MCGGSMGYVSQHHNAAGAAACDLLPENWTVVDENFPVGLAIGQPGGTGDEAFAVQRAADRVHSAPGRGRCGGRGCVPQGRHLAADLLSVEEEVWRSDAVGDETAEAAGGGERPAEAVGGRPVAGQSHV